MMGPQLMRTFGRGPVQPSRVCVCASTSRLRLTPEMFLMQLREGHAFSHAIRPSMQVILEWVASADIAEWLVPEPDYVEPAHCTFRDSELVLCLLEVQSHDRPMIPKLPSSSLLGLKLGVRGPLTVTPTVSSTQERNACKPYLRVSHCLSLTAPFDEVAFVLCLEGWCGFAQPPRPETSAPAHHHSLTAETLGGDLLRFALRLWSQGTPTMLLFSPPSASAVAPFSEIRHLQQREQDGLRFLINAWQGW